MYLRTATTLQANKVRGVASALHQRLDLSEKQKTAQICRWDFTVNEEIGATLIQNYGWSLRCPV
jgi:hypothetical protein